MIADERSLKAEEANLISHRTKIDSMRDEITNTQAQVDSITEAVQAVQKQILEIGGDKYKKVKEALDDCKRSLSDKERTAAKNKATLENAEQFVQKVDAEIQNFTDLISAANKAKADLDAQIDKIDDLANEILAAQHKIAADKEAAEK